MAEVTDNTNPLTGKSRTKSNGSPLGDATEAYYAAETRQAKFEILKGNVELQKHFRLDEYADLNK